MIILPPYMYDRESYLLMPVEHRWIYNKLNVAERLGYHCGPAGTDIPDLDGKREVTVRPIYNLYGEQHNGGFYHQKRKRGRAADDNRRVPNEAGWFWCERFPGVPTWDEYVNDVCVSSSDATWDEATKTVTFEEVAKADRPPLPDIFKGISRYMMVERVGDKIVEVSPRHCPESARQSVIDDYKQFDPNYDPNPEDVIVQYESQMRLEPHPDGRGFQWRTVPGSQRPHRDT